jgi:hypothetical protein
VNTQLFPLKFSHQEKLTCLERELRLRQRVYPGLVEQKKLSPRSAAREIALIEALILDYTTRKDIQEAS